MNFLFLFNNNRIRVEVVMVMNLESTDFARLLIDGITYHSITKNFG